MSEKREELEGQLSEMASLATTWKSFMEHPGWELYNRILREQMNLRQQTVCLTPISSENTVYAQEYYKGEFSGIGMALAIPQSQYELVDLRRKTLVKELEIEDDVESEMAARESGRESRIGGDPFGE